MAQRTEIDAGAQTARFDIDREKVAAGGAAPVVVMVKTNRGELSVDLTRAELLAATTAGERTAFVATLDKLYAAALVKLGFE